MLVASHVVSGDQAVAAVLPPSRCRTIPPFDKVMALCSPCCAPQRSALLRKQVPYKGALSENMLGHARC